MGKSNQGTIFEGTTEWTLCAPSLPDSPLHRLPKQCSSGTDKIKL